ncbi:hypothetical protein AWM68_09775 [Fictibacillus phosphorivorans]|uniref:Uncharacterized protein n=2 Tax=Fictibacillus phosphorivorans TaxID=1221500 RepID=A0A161RTU5_9BACL|nr:hypothetical protein AWM68_09775 [Fictibacillus phosphorivorans]
MFPINTTFVRLEHTKYDYIFHIAFAVLLCLYSFLILFSSKLLGFLFFCYGLFLLGFTVWKGIRMIYSIPGVLVGLTALFFSRLLWMDAFQILPNFFYEIFQVVFFLGFGVGITLLYNLASKSAPFSNIYQRHGIHGMYFATGILLFPYTWIFSYGALKQGNYNSLVWAVLILILWGILYALQLITPPKKGMGIALYAVNIGVGCWTIYRWIMIVT